MKYFRGRVMYHKRLQGLPQNYPEKISLDLDKMKRLCGSNLNQDMVNDILTKLGFIYEYKQTYKIPTWRRGDIVNTTDIVEEVVRMSDIFSTYSPCNSSNLTYNLEDIIIKIKYTLSYRGLYEVITWSFIQINEAKLFDNLNILIDNPISSDMSAMRTSIIPGLLKSISKNICESVEGCSFFEIGHVFNKRKSSIIETKMLSTVRYGVNNNNNIHHCQKLYSYFDVKYDLEVLLKDINIEIKKIIFVEGATNHYHPGKCATIYLKDIKLGYIGTLHPVLLREFNIKKEVHALEIFLDKIPTHLFQKKEDYIQPKMQKIKRDFSFLFDREITWAKIVATIKSLSIDLIFDIQVFDIFKSTKFCGKKSISFRIYLQPKVRTLVESEINAISNSVITVLQDNLGAELRS